MTTTRRAVRIRRCRPADARAVCRLISRTYARFCGQEGTPAAVRRYVQGYDPKGRRIEELQVRLARTPGQLVATSGGVVVGVVRWREDRMVNLFVAAAYHRQGIATRLVRRFEQACRRSGFERAVLRASLYAVPFYQSVGYRKTTGVRTFHGLKIQPMRKRLDRA